MGRPANDPIYAFPRSIYDLVETFASPEEAADIYRSILRFYFEGVEITPEEMGDERTACLVRSFLGRVVCARRSALAKSESGKADRGEGGGEHGTVRSDVSRAKRRGLRSEKPGKDSCDAVYCREVRTETEGDSNIPNTQVKALPSKREVEVALEECSRSLGIPLDDAGKEASGFLAYNEARGWCLSGGVRAADWRPLATKWVLATRRGQETPGRSLGKARKERGCGEGRTGRGDDKFRRLAAEPPSMRRGFDVDARL